MCVWIRCVCGFDVCESEADLNQGLGAREIRSALWPLVRPTAPFTKSLKKADAISVEPRFDADICLFVLAGTLQWIRLPSTYAAFVVGKSSLGRRGMPVMRQ
jgi:hypothetical protein